MLFRSRRRFIRATGEERADFLHGQLSGDVRGLVEGSGCPALLLNGQGRVVTIFVVYCRFDELLLATDVAWLARAREGLERYLVADDCEFENLPPTPTIGVVGPHAVPVLQEAGFGGRLDAERYSITDGEIAGVEVRVFGRGCLRVPSFDVCCRDFERAGEFEVVGGERTRAGAVAVGVSAYECVRVESGVARYGVDIDDSRLALEARLHWAVHFAKGCYLGQEPIARLDAMGHVNRQLCRLNLTSGPVPERDSVIVADDGDTEIGRVTSAAVSPATNLPVALAYLRRQFLTPGTNVFVQVAGENIAATVSRCESE